MRKRLTALQSSEIIREILSQAKVIPVLTVTDSADAVPLARSLTDGGLNVLEVTLRTKNALHVIEEMSKLKQAVVGVGTLLNRRDVENAVKVGAKFGVSPGLTDDLIVACEENGLPLLGGVASVSEAMKVYDRGYDSMKFFPAESLGGVLTLKAIEAPLPQVAFCPTGGISLENAENYLAQKNVACIGGSWMATPDMIRNKKWSEIAHEATIAATLGK